MKELHIFDYEKFMSQFVVGFKEDLGLTLRPSYGNATVPEYPYVTYDFIDTHIDIGSSVELQDQFDIVLMFIGHSNLLSESLEAGNKMMMWLKDREIQYQLSDKGIDVIQIYDQSVLNNPMAIDTDRRVKFEARFRVINVPEDETNPAIEEVVTNDNIRIKKG
ncbi:LIC_12616 family protein [Fructobacillus tropaeoli]|uniref:Phage neck terminator protein gp12-like domain-containing protein n=1 Tax=Fructobacillus tropaeoli TaxID=709323 RepID=A0ABN9YNC4_9LACO|nr:hypothetical protein [Fructobacillus tropaeoli]GIC70616.1 hypothetical protein FT12353_12920 [Fructobacillus tropaeoli]CAK1228382.1 hypothetical protein R53137_KAKDMLNK_00229 [Fructobacillus tropaeoli]CAK1235089.1 hypothetical protein LMG30238_FMBOGHMB_00636 [Fructobacillus tropaeoli]